LGQTTRVKRIEVTWPGNPTPQIFEPGDGAAAIPLDQTIELTEGDPELRVIQQPALRLHRLDQVGTQTGPD
jgi:hypothetical protein